MNNVLILILIIAPIVILIAVELFWHFSKGRKVKITVTNKRKSVHDAFSQVTYSNSTSTNYTIDCTYGNSAKVHTLGCEQSVYDQLKNNKTYLVTVKMMQIIKVHHK